MSTANREEAVPAGPYAGLPRYPAPPVTVCSYCHRGPARPLVIRRHVGYLVLQKFVRIEPTLCRDCGTKLVLSYTGRTLIQGWWGLISFVIANPFTIIMNMKTLIQARRIPPAEYTLRPRGLPRQAETTPAGDAS